MLRNIIRFVLIAMAGSHQRGYRKKGSYGPNRHHVTGRRSQNYDNSQKKRS